MPVHHFTLFSILYRLLSKFIHSNFFILFQFYYTSLISPWHYFFQPGYIHSKCILYLTAVYHFAFLKPVYWLDLTHRKNGGSKEFLLFEITSVHLQGVTLPGKVEGYWFSKLYHEANPILVALGTTHIFTDNLFIRRGHTNTCCNLLKEKFPSNFPKRLPFSHQITHSLVSLPLPPRQPPTLSTITSLMPHCDTRSVLPTTYSPWLENRLPFHHALAPPVYLINTLVPFSWPCSTTHTSTISSPSATPSHLTCNPSALWLPPPPLCAYLSQTLFYWGPWNAILAKLRPN